MYAPEQQVQFTLNEEPSLELQLQLKQWIESSDLFSWQNIHHYITSSPQSKEENISVVLKVFRRSALKVGSYCMLMYIYIVSIEHTMSTSDWEIIKSIINRKDYLLNKFNKAANVPQAQRSLFMLSHALPQYLIREKAELSTGQFNAIVLWLHQMHLTEPLLVQYACNLVKILRRASLSGMNDYENKEQLLLKECIKVLSVEEKPHSNIDLLFGPTLINCENIRYFCQLNGEYISELEDECANIFLNLSTHGLNKQILLLLNLMSMCLEAKDSYYTLRILLERYILPVLAARYKFAKDIEADVYSLVEIYCVGMIDHVDIGSEGVASLLCGLHEIKDYSMREKWINLAVVIASRSEALVPQMERYLQENHIDTTLARAKDNIVYRLVWRVTNRQSRKTKRYIYTASKVYKGITNRVNECYIISVMQSISMTGQLPLFLEKYFPTIKGLPLLSSLRSIFEGLSDNKTHAKDIMVKKVKETGPEMFRKIKTQEDAQQYILFLFETIEGELKKYPNLLAEFKRIFQIQYKNHIKCNNCSRETTDTSIGYIHTYSYKEDYSVATQETIDGYRCDECGKLGCTMERTHIGPAILILHINRFSHIDGEMKKELTNRPIPRWIVSYELVGFICHQGRTISRGHYIYYAKIEDQKWVVFNDNEAKEFSLTQKDQQFEKQLKSNTTPYILFYRRFE